MLPLLAVVAPIIGVFGALVGSTRAGAVPRSTPRAHRAVDADPGSAYWEVAFDGGTFSWGSAGFFGSTGGAPLNEPIVGMAVVPSTGALISSTNLTGVPCPTTTFCMAVDDAGGYAFELDPSLL